MTMKTKPTDPVSEDLAMASLAAPEPVTRGVPAELLTAMAVQVEGRQLSSSLDLEALLDHEIKGWTPEIGDKLIGRVVNVEVAGEGSIYGPYPLLTIRREGGDELVALHAFHTVLRRELGRRQVGMGDRLGIKYLGRTEGGGVGDYEDYRVVVEPVGGAHVDAAWAKK